MLGDLRVSWSKLLVFAAFIAVLLLVAYLLTPLLDGIVLGLVFAYVARPLKSWLASRMKRSERVTALLDRLDPSMKVILAAPSCSH